MFAGLRDTDIGVDDFEKCARLKAFRVRDCTLFPATPAVALAIRRGCDQPSPATWEELQTAADRITIKLPVVHV